MNRAWKQDMEHTHENIFYYRDVSSAGIAEKTCLSPANSADVIFISWNTCVSAAHEKGTELLCVAVWMWS